LFNRIMEITDDFPDGLTRRDPARNGLFPNSEKARTKLDMMVDRALLRFARRELESEHPCLIIGARYEKLRENRVIRRAVLVAIAIDWEGRRQVLGVEIANRESDPSHSTDGSTYFWILRRFRKARDV
jgi:hypothetical protein